MIASVYIKDGNIHFYNEDTSLSDIGGLAYELGRPLLDFVCYEPERFIDGFSMIAEAFNSEYAHIGAKDEAFISALKEIMSESQQKEIYLFFYQQMLMDFIYKFIDSPREAVEQLAETIPDAEEKLRWAMNFEWPKSKSTFIKVGIFADKEKRLFRAAKDAVALMYEQFCVFQQFVVSEIEVLLHYRKEIEVPEARSIDYLDCLDVYHTEYGFENCYVEAPYLTFYGRVTTGTIEQLYVIDSIEDLFRFEFMKMMEHDIFIKKCKNCEQYFIPRRRVDAEYCERAFGETGRKCSEIGAMLRYEKKVAENPILEAHKKAYRRLHSRTRNKKMTQTEFMRWADEAVKKRDACMAGELAFDDFVEWLEQGRVRKARGGNGT